MFLYWKFCIITEMMCLTSITVKFELLLLKWPKQTKQQSFGRKGYKFSQIYDLSLFKWHLYSQHIWFHYIIIYIPDKNTTNTKNIFTLRHTYYYCLIYETYIYSFLFYVSGFFRKENITFVGLKKYKFILRGQGGIWCVSNFVVVFTSRVTF